MVTETQCDDPRRRNFANISATGTRPRRVARSSVCVGVPGTTSFASRDLPDSTEDDAQSAGLGFLLHFITPCAYSMHVDKTSSPVISLADCREFTRSPATRRESGEVMPRFLRLLAAGRSHDRAAQSGVAGITARKFSTAEPAASGLPVERFHARSFCGRRFGTCVEYIRRRRRRFPSRPSQR